MNCNDCASRSCLVFKYCSDENTENILNKKSCIEYPSRQNIIKEGSLITGVFFVQSGTVKVFKDGLNGKEQIIRIAKPGDILGHRGFSKNMNYPISALTLEKSKICFLEYDAFFSLLKTTPEFTLKMFELYAATLTDAEARLRNMAQMTVRERIAETLLLIFTSVSTDNIGALNIVLSRQEIADIAGTNADQVSRELVSLEKDGIISLKGRQIVIKDLEKLEVIIEKYD